MVLDLTLSNDLSGLCLHIAEFVATAPAINELPWYEEKILPYSITVDTGSR